MEELIYLDTELFKLINIKMQNSFFDTVLPILRHSMCWVPLYLFLMIFALVNYSKNVWWWILFAIATAGLTDMISSDLIKENIFRIRPCHDSSLARVLVSYCPQSSSFTSSHATNHFGLAAFFSMTLKDVPKKWRYAFFFWAWVIILAQVYVGVHYPLDVLAGGAVGLVFGYLSGKTFNRVYGLS
jgi:undecaprenyl-diphosphatase